DRQPAAGVVLIHVDFGELLVRDLVGQAGREAQARHAEAGTGRHRRTLQSSVAEANLSQKTRRKTGSQNDPGITRWIGADRGSRKRLIDQPEREAAVLR